ncbi:MAG: BamA/TamA family outer membrane protein [Candidatus Eisenbacteria bacterium]|nr:BamA/TamA family outer membrane protein [Candidatus Eisenbacteria bacterium]
MTISMAPGSSSARDALPRRALLGGRALPGVSGSARRLLATLLLACLWALSAGAQHISFGKNKVNYRDFDWQVMASEHFDLYYYPEEAELARIAISFAEQSYDHLSAHFAHEISESVPIILYSSHHDFEQTNITPMLIPEGVGGLTETVRGRVLMPFDGSFHQFFETLHHELVHVFQRSIGQRVFRERFRHRMPSPPLWFTEGLADHWSGRWDPDGDMVLRDLVLTGRVPPISRFWTYNGTFVLYKLGQSVLDFIGETYGEDKIALFYFDAWKVRRFEELFPLVLGVTQQELSERWMHWVRERYYPEVADADPVLLSARVVSRGAMVLKPTPVPEGVAGYENQYVFISPRSGYASIYVASLEEGEQDARTLVRGQRQPEYLSFHAFRSRMDISSQGILAFSSHAGAQDLLVAYDLEGEEAIVHWSFADLVGISSPHWDGSGTRLVFSGLRRDGRRDLYLYDAGRDSLRALTADRFVDEDPAWHPDGRWVVFVSDRGAHGRAGARNLFLLDLETGAISPLTAGPWWDLSPAWSPDGRAVLFVSTRDGMRDLYLIDRNGRGARLTHAIEALRDPRWLPSGEEILASVYHEGRFSTVVLDRTAPAPADSFVAAPPVKRAAWNWEAAAESTRVRRERYRSAFALDVAQGGVAVDPSLGTGEGLQILLRDMMGNRLIFMQVGNTTISTRDFLDNFSAGVTYIDLSRRLNRGFSLYHHAGNYYDELGFPFFERRAGFSALLSYPLSRFTRVESSFGAAFSEKEKPSTDVYRRGLIATHYVSWIHDTSLWHTTGPLDGGRSHLTLGLTMNLRRPGVENVLLLADTRRYVRLGQLSALALRLQTRLSGGPDPQVFLLGGSHSLRGYPWRDLHGTRSLLANTELRFPLLRGFVIDPALVGALGFPGVQGAIFLDAGQVWYEGWPDAWRGSYGLGFRMGLGGILVLRLDLARRTDFRDWPRKTHTEFFVGWNY